MSFTPETPIHSLSLPYVEYIIEDLFNIPHHIIVVDEDRLGRLASLIAESGYTWDQLVMTLHKAQCLAETIPHPPPPHLEVVQLYTTPLQGLEDVEGGQCIWDWTLWLQQAQREAAEDKSVAWRVVAAHAQDSFLQAFHLRWLGVDQVYAKVNPPSLRPSCG
ncbi:MAG: hypothetical protein OXT67_03680 [Zetaproteobacteria bacterium]|nr:hypothetical protein [Zetaproteobacteria bacterium]